MELNEAQFDKLARDELAHIEEALLDVDPDDVDVSTSDGIIQLELRDGVRAVINSHRAARQIWMAAIASAWRFDYDESDGRWRTAGGDELRQTVVDLVKQRVGVSVDL